LRNASTSSGEGGRYKCRWSRDFDNSCCGNGILGGSRCDNIVVWIAGGRGGGDMFGIVIVQQILA
jgi:hypothetical protein